MWVLLQKGIRISREFVLKTKSNRGMVLQQSQIEENNNK